MIKKTCLLLFLIFLQLPDLKSVGLENDLTALHNNFTNLYEQLKKVPRQPTTEFDEKKEIARKLMEDYLRFLNNAASIYGKPISIEEIRIYEKGFKKLLNGLDRKQRETIDQIRAIYQTDYDTVIKDLLSQDRLPELGLMHAYDQLDEFFKELEEKYAKKDTSLERKDYATLLNQLKMYVSLPKNMELIEKYKAADIEYLFKKFDLLKKEKEKKATTGKEAKPIVQILPVQYSEFAENPELQKLLQNDYERLEDFEEKILKFQEKLTAFFEWAENYAKGKQDRNFVPPAFHELMEQFKKLPSAAYLLHLIEELNKYKQNASKQDAVAVIEFLRNLGNYLHYLVGLIRNGSHANYDILQSGAWSYNKQILGGQQHYQNNILNYALKIKSTFLEESGGRVIYEGEKSNVLNDAIRSWQRQKEFAQSA